jgi:putative SOS response-associated peptidase YedK
MKPRERLPRGFMAYDPTMCGRYTLVNLAHLTQLFPWITEPPVDVPARYNIAPSQPILAVANDKPDHYDFFLWGLIPTWAKDPKIGNKLCNARAETLAEKNTFKNAYRRRRCLIPADGFYEWKFNADGKTKQPMYIRLKNAEPFALAGLWETWHGKDGEEIRSATIVTTAANEMMKEMHDRMPVILPRDAMRRWIDSGEKAAGELDDLLLPFASEMMEAYPVSKDVNSPRNEGVRLIERVEPVKTTLFG